MKKVARLRMPADDAYVAAYNHATSGGSNEQLGVRTTGRIKKPKAVFDPSDNYLPRAQRMNSTFGLNAIYTTEGVTIPTDRKRLSVSSYAPDVLHGKKVARVLSTTSSSTTTTTSTLTEPPPADLCDVCLKREAKRGTYAKNKLITCLDCDKKVHKLCLKADFEDLNTLRQHFKCDACRSCDVCAAFSELDAKDKELVTCTKCVKSYHLNCHIPSVLKFQQYQRNWKCNKCTLPVLSNETVNVNADSSVNLPVQAIREIIGDEVPASLKSQPHSHINIAAAAAEAKHTAAALANGSDNEDDMSRKQKRQKRNSNEHNDIDNDDLQADSVTTTNNGAGNANNNNNNASVRYSPNEPMDLPDVKEWNVDQVTEFFAKYFPNEAHVFKEQEIDGMSLLLLKRSDVIKKLPIKLGPSLRIYSLILKIQTQLNDPTLGWNCGL